MASEGYYESIRSAYDRIAPTYDDSVGSHAVSRRAKQLVLKAVKEATPPGGRLLDVGCYTGIEALLLAQAGYQVLGVDLSDGMIDLARSKAERWRLQDRLEFRNLPASEIGSIAGTGAAPFDTVYSAYGTLNLEPRLGDFKAGLDRVLKPEGVFVCGLLNPTVFYELCLAPMFLQFHGYRKLAKRPVQTHIGIGDDTVEAFLYSPGEFASIMAPEFRLERVMGLHVLYPPPRGRGGKNLWWIPRALDGLEYRLEGRYPFSWLGFFSLMIFRRARSVSG